MSGRDLGSSSPSLSPLSSEWEGEEGRREEGEQKEEERPMDGSQSGRLNRGRLVGKRKSSEASLIGGDFLFWDILQQRSSVDTGVHRPEAGE